MLRKQVVSIGCPPWTDVLHELGVAHDAGDYMKFGEQVHGYIQCTDAGPDEVYAGKIIGCGLAPSLRMLHFRGNCFKHQAALAVHHGMAGVDRLLGELGIKWKYFSTLERGGQYNTPSLPSFSLPPAGPQSPLPIRRPGAPVSVVEWSAPSQQAKMSNLARDKPRALYWTWASEHSVIDAACVAGVNPRCLSGRWNSVTSVEKYYMNMGHTPLQRRDKYIKVARKVFGSGNPPAPAPAAAGAGRGRARGRGSRGGRGGCQGAGTSQNTCPQGPQGRVTSRVGEWGRGRGCPG